MFTKDKLSDFARLTRAYLPAVVLLLAMSASASADSLDTLGTYVQTHTTTFGAAISGAIALAGIVTALVRRSVGIAVAGIVAGGACLAISSLTTTGTGMVQ